MFPPTPDCFTEVGFAIFPEEQDEADAWKGPRDPVGGLDIADVSNDSKTEMKEAMQLDDDQIASLLKEGEIEAGFGCVCIECQDAGLTEEELQHEN